MHPIERLQYSLVKVYTLDKSNRRSEAIEEVDHIVKEIQDNNYIDMQLIDQAEVIL